MAPAQVPKVGLVWTKSRELLEKFLGQQFQERGGFAAGNDEAVDLVEVFGLAHEGDRRPEFFEPAAVGVEIALQCEDTDGGDAFRHSLFAFRRRGCRPCAVSQN